MPSSRDSFRRNRVAPDGYNYLSIRGREGQNPVAQRRRQPMGVQVRALAGKHGHERGVREN